VIAHWATFVLLMALAALVAVALGIDMLPRRLSCRWRGHPMTQRRILWNGRLSRLWVISCRCGKLRRIERQCLKESARRASGRPSAR